MATATTQPGDNHDGLWAGIRRRSQEAARSLGTDDVSNLDAMWSRLDVNGNSLVSLAEIDKWVTEQATGASEGEGDDGSENFWKRMNHKPALMRAYKLTTSREGGGDGDAYVEKKEFKALLVNLFWFADLWNVFDEVDSSDDRRIDLDELKAGLRKLDLAHGESLDSDAEAIFQDIDDNGGGFILFDEFCAYVREKALEPQDSTVVDVSQESALQGSPAEAIAETEAAAGDAEVQSTSEPVAIDGDTPGPEASSDAVEGTAFDHPNQEAEQDQDAAPLDDTVEATSDTGGDGQSEGAKDAAEGLPDLVGSTPEELEIQPDASNEGESSVVADTVEDAKGDSSSETNGGIVEEKETTLGSTKRVTSASESGRENGDELIHTEMLERVKQIPSAAAKQKLDEAWGAAARAREESTCKQGTGLDDAPLCSPLQPKKVLSTRPPPLAAPKGDGVRVFCRFRPLPENDNAALEGKVPCIRMGSGSGGGVDVSNSFRLFGPRGEVSTFRFDEVFGTQATQVNVYEASVLPLVKNVIEGYNCSALMYGQTGSGKTHTMLGPPNMAFDNTDSRGIIPRALCDIFSEIDAGAGADACEVSVSFLEVYQEKVYDLLNPQYFERERRDGTIEKRRVDLRMREATKHDVRVVGAQNESVKTVPEALQVLEKGRKNRQTAATKMNTDSSRSHCIFTINVRSPIENDARTSPEGGCAYRIGTLWLVDLAGSEQVGKTGATGSTFNEARKINKSLSVLGNVIKALVEDASYVPYRDSKLTRLMQNALSDNAKLSLIVTASVEPTHFLETMSTARFGTRAKYLSLNAQPRVNEDRPLNDYKLMFHQEHAKAETLRRGIRSLKRENTKLKEQNLNRSKEVQSLIGHKREHERAEKLKLSNIKLMKAIAALRNKRASGGSLAPIKHPSTPPKKKPLPSPVRVSAPEKATLVKDVQEPKVPSPPPRRRPPRAGAQKDMKNIKRPSPYAKKIGPDSKKQSANKKAGKVPSAPAKAAKGEEKQKPPAQPAKTKKKNSAGKRRPPGAAYSKLPKPTKLSAPRTNATAA